MKIAVILLATAFIATSNVGRNEFNINTKISSVTFTGDAVAAPTNWGNKIFYFPGFKLNYYSHRLAESP